VLFVIAIVDRCFFTGYAEEEEEEEEDDLKR